MIPDSDVPFCIRCRQTLSSSIQSWAKLLSKSAFSPVDAVLYRQRAETLSAPNPIARLRALCKCPRPPQPRKGRLTPLRPCASGLAWAGEMIAAQAALVIDIQR